MPGHKGQEHAGRSHWPGLPGVVVFRAPLAARPSLQVLPQHVPHRLALPGVSGRGAATGGGCPARGAGQRNP